MDAVSGKIPKSSSSTPELPVPDPPKTVSCQPVMKLFTRYFIVLLNLLWYTGTSAQTDTYIRNGAATQNTCNCYTLTTATVSTSGSVWNASKINLANPFDFIFNVYLGCLDETGADGIVFMLQPISTSVGTSGGGMGFEGVIPSVGVTLDTWQNPQDNDPFYDHIAIQANGNLNHSANLAGPEQASVSSPNIEDCQWHTLRITWDPSTTTLRAYFDNVLRVSSTVDIVATVFGNDPQVFWGFSGATGGSYNLQQFCTALNPSFTTNNAANTACIGETLDFTNGSESFAPIASYYWNLGDGTTYNTRDIPPHTYSAPGVYDIKMAITGFDGCNSDTLRRTVTVGDYPAAGFTVEDTCAGKPPRLVNTSSVTVGTINQWNWQVDGNPYPSVPIPDLTSLPAGNYGLSLDVTSSAGCTSPVFRQQLELLPVPELSAAADDGCAGLPIQFNATQLDVSTTVSNWLWQFQPGNSSTLEDPAYIFTQPGNYNVSLSAVSDNGCQSDPVNIPVFVNRAVAFAGRDTVVIKSEPYQLNGSGGGTYLWSPDTWMNDNTSANPVVTPDDDITYRLQVTTAEGCVGTDDVTLSVFKGSAIFVPSAFSPNRDGINEKLGPYYVGIREVGYFMVYNRWGQLIYSTRDRLAQWDGSINGMPQPSGVYVWRLAATDFVGKKYELKGTTTLIR